MPDGSHRSIIIPYTRRDAFKPFHASKHRWGALVAHRRAGKTVALVNRLIRSAISVRRTHPVPQVAYIGPFLNQAKRVAWSYCQHYAYAITKGTNVGDHSIELINGARLMLLGADNADAIRGIYLDDAVLDEFGDMRPTVWSSIVRPTLSDYNGRAVFAGTPRGLNEFWNVYRRSRESPEEWFSATLKASETGILPEDELRDARASMTSDEYAREYECSFEASHAGAYYGRELREARDEQRIGTFPIVSGLPLHFAFDLGFTDSTACWVWQALPERIRVVAYYEASGQSVDHYLSWLHQWRQGGRIMGDVWLPHDARAASFQTGRTTVEQFISGGVQPKLIPQVGLQHGIDAARLMFRTMEFHEPDTADGISCLTAYQREYNEDRKVYSDRPRHDWASHGADAFRYMALVCRTEAPTRDDRPPVYAVPVNQSFQLDDLWSTAGGSKGARI